jgi:Flp pilus assembly protein TadB
LPESANRNKPNHTRREGLAGQTKEFGMFYIIASLIALAILAAAFVATLATGAMVILIAGCGVALLVLFAAIAWDNANDAAKAGN